MGEIYRYFETKQYICNGKFIEIMAHIYQREAMEHLLTWKEKEDRKPLVNSTPQMYTS